MLIFRWVAGVLLLLVSTWLCVLNAGVFWKLFVRKVEASSWIPLLGGVFGMIGLLVLPFEPVHRWWWVPLLLDWGSLPGMSHAILFHLCRLARK